MIVLDFRMELYPAFCKCYWNGIVSAHFFYVKIKKHGKVAGKHIGNDFTLRFDRPWNVGKSIHIRQNGI